METSDQFIADILTSGPSPETVFIVLKKLKEDGYHNRVIQEGIKALAIYPNDIRIRHLMAETYLESGRVFEAEKEIIKVVTHLKELISSSCRIQSGIFKKQKRTDKAIEALKQYLLFNPDDAAVLGMLEELEITEEPTPVSRLDMVEESIVQEDITEEIKAREAEETIPEIATPTIAEIYFDQGRVKEAITIYEKVIEERPDDEKSRQRLKELQGIWTGNIQEEGTPGEDLVKQKKERMIEILESWLINIRKQAKSSLSAN